MLIALLVYLVIIGVVLYLVNTLIPMDPRFKTLINAIVIVATCLWLLSEFGILPARFGHIR